MRRSAIGTLVALVILAALLVLTGCSGSLKIDKTDSGGDLFEIPAPCWPAGCNPCQDPKP